MARPVKLTPEAQEKICDAIRLGATYALAAGYGGIVYNTFNKWMRRGREQKTGCYRNFYESVKQAEGEGALAWLRKIEEAASEGNWQAAAWKLERRYPRDYGRNIDLRANDNDDDGAQVVILPDNARNDRAPD